MSKSSGVGRVMQHAMPVGFTGNSRLAQYGNMIGGNPYAGAQEANMSSPGGPSPLGGPTRGPVAPANIYTPPPRNMFQPYGRMNPYQALFMRQLMGSSGRGLL